MYVVDWWGVLYGPFESSQAAAMFRPPMDVPAMNTMNMMHQGQVREVMAPKERSQADMR